MTWFRVGGAGIPATLKNAMNAVFNKKFGTSGQNYPPKQWPDDVNLLGPLPEGTASGPIANFSDGADDVPTKSLVVTIPPTPSGVSSVTETQTGRNLFYIENSSLFPRDNNTIVDNIGTYTAWARVKKNTDYYIKKSGNTNRQNVFGCTSVPAVGVTTYMLARTEYATNEYRFNSGEYEYIGFYYSNEASENMMMALSQDDVSNYEPYNGTTHTASLGRTIYGGSVDVVKGNCEPTNWLDDTLANLEQGSINGSTGANESANNRVRNASAIPFPYDEIVSNYTWTIPSGYKVAIRPYDANGNFVQLPSWALAFITQLPQDLVGQGITQMRFVLAKTDNSAITPSDMAEVGYILNKGNTAETYSPYFAPFTFSPVEINSLYGVNNFWNDAGGDTTVVYRRDIDLALQAVSSSRGLMMASRPVTQLVGEESDPDQVNELVENDKTEQEGEDNAR